MGSKIYRRRYFTMGSDWIMDQYCMYLAERSSGIIDLTLESIPMSSSLSRMLCSVSPTPSSTHRPQTFV